jgi:hypothetical protein
MKTLLILAVAGTAFAGSPTPANLADPKAKTLVQQLGSPRYRERERAATDLIHMGRAAIPALSEGKANPDPEVQARCEQLLPQAKALDLTLRVERFRKDADGKLEHDLPMWKTFREKIGTDIQARNLFGDMLLANGDLLESIEEQPDKLSERVQRRAQELYQELYGNPWARQQLGEPLGNRSSANEVCCLLFAAASPAYKPAPNEWMLASLYPQPAFTNFLKDPKTGAAYRKVFFNFLDARMDDNTVSHCYWVLCQNKLTEGADVLAKALKNGKVSQPYSKAMAMSTIGTIGGKEHVAGFEPFLKDDTQVQQFVGKGMRGSVRIRDVALAMSIHLSGKNPKDFGYMWNVYPNQPVPYHQLGFGTDEERAAAFKKWGEETKKPEPPKK